eukprot:TRINITY_DN4322_c0_g1_i1.p1 TRINITY_DN4322_c0_g1~~TRINITY_DN4322_c0_g1_i1.p1  ORF type:complete len:186 (-),score=46.08 TRINITY_DN4322_c0_g1_i1:142-699(-)
MDHLAIDLIANASTGKLDWNNLELSRSCTLSREDHIFMKHISSGVKNHMDTEQLNIALEGSNRWVRDQLVEYSKSSACDWLPTTNNNSVFESLNTSFAEKWAQTESALGNHVSRFTDLVSSAFVEDSSISQLPSATSPPLGNFLSAASNFSIPNSDENQFQATANSVGIIFGDFWNATASVLLKK